MGFKIESSLLDACALAILHRGDTYGYEITQEMKKSITVSESTLYPVLRRLQSEELCRTYDQPYQGRNRRYYSITEKGEAKLLDYLTQWYQYRNAIQTLLEGPARKEELDKAKESDVPAMSEGSGKEKGEVKTKVDKKAKPESGSTEAEDIEETEIIIEMADDSETEDAGKTKTVKESGTVKEKKAKKTESGSKAKSEKNDNKTKSKKNENKVKNDRTEKTEGGAADE